MTWILFLALIIVAAVVMGPIYRESFRAVPCLKRPPMTDWRRWWQSERVGRDDVPTPVVQLVQQPDSASDAAHIPVSVMLWGEKNISSPPGSPITSISKPIQPRDRQRWLRKSTYNNRWPVIKNTTKPSGFATPYVPRFVGSTPFYVNRQIPHKAMSMCSK